MKSNKYHIPIDALKQLLTYDAASGNLIWLPREEGFFTKPGYADRFNKRCAYTVAGCATSNKTGSASLHVKIAGKIYLAHRICWAIYHEEWPEDDTLIDHIDRNPFNNRINNLREATHSQNQQNKCGLKGTSSKYKGVTWNKKEQKWIVKIGLNNVKHYFGMFDSEDEAGSRAAQAYVDLHGEFMRLNSE